jgi:chitinase
MRKLYHQIKVILFGTLLSSMTVQAQLPSKVLMGYHERYFTTKLTSAHANYNVICLAFATPTVYEGCNMIYNLPVGYTGATAKADFMADIDMLHAQGKVVLLSIGGGNSPIKLNTTADKTTFVNSINAILDNFNNKIDGIDLDFENSSMAFGPWTMTSPAAGQTNIINAVKEIMAYQLPKLGKKLIVTAVPEAMYICGGQNQYHIDTYHAGAFLPILVGLTNEIDLLAMQAYNVGGASGGITAWNGVQYFDTGTPDFVLAMNETAIKGYTLLSGLGTFNGFPSGKLAFGTPATRSTSTASSGYVTPAALCDAAKYWKGEVTAMPASVSYNMPTRYPDLRGLMTWSIDEDAKNIDGAFNFAIGFPCAFTTSTVPVADITMSIAGACVGQSVTFTDASTNTPTSWSWNFGSGASLASSTSKGPHTISYNTTGSKTITLTATNGSGTNTVTKTFVVSATSANAGAITGTTAVCQASTQTYSIAAVANATTYTWTVPLNTIINSGQGSTSINVTIGGTAGNIGVTPSNGCSSGAASTLALTITQAIGSAGAISGSSTVCSGSTNQTYSVGSVANATGYTWTVPSGATITSGQGSTTITVTFGSTSGNVSVTPTAACGNGTASATAVTVSAAPGAAGVISGGTSKCSGQTAQVYSISAVNGATTYTWTCPSGATITAGQGTTSITVTFGSTSGNIGVTPANSCLNGSPSSLAITVAPSTVAAGAITGSSSVCDNSVNLLYSISPVSGANSYTWTAPPGSTITGGQGTSGVSISFGSSSGNVTVTPVVACGNGTSSSLAVTVSPVAMPTATITASNTTICTGGSVTFTASSTNGGPSPSYAWQLNGLAAGTNSPSFTSSSLANNDVVRVVMTSNAACKTTGTATSNSITMTVTAGSTPTASIAASNTTICSGANVTFTATTANAGTPSFAWKVNGIAAGIDAATFSSTSLSNNDIVKVIITPTGSCNLSPVSSNSITVIVNSPAAANVSIVASSTSICSGASVTFTANPTNGGTPSYAWQVNGAASGTNAGTFTSTAMSNNDVVKVIMTSSASCVSPSVATSNSITMSVASGSTPAVSISTSNTSVCSGTNVTFTATPSNAGAPSYAWKINGVTAGSNAPTFSSTSLSNNDIVKVIMTPTGSCNLSPVSSNSITMAVYALVTPAVSIAASTNSICPGTNVTFAATPANGGASPVYQWKLNSTIISGATSSSYSNASLKDGDIVSTVLTSSINCASSSTAISNNITITAKPGSSTSLGTVTGNATPCKGSTATYSVANTAAGSYAWSFTGSGGAFSGTANSINISFASMTSGTLSVSAMNACGANASSTMGITVIDRLIPSYFTDSSASVSRGQKGVVYAVVKDPYSTYSWSYNGGTPTITGNGQNSVSVDFGQADNSGTISVYAMNACGNSAIRSMAVTVKVLTGLQTIFANSGLTVYPNPSTEISTVSITLDTASPVSLLIYDVTGKEIYSFGNAMELGMGNHTFICPSSLPAGMYMIQMNSNQKIVRTTLVKN